MIHKFYSALTLFAVLASRPCFCRFVLPLRVGGYVAEIVPGICDGKPIHIDDRAKCSKCLSSDDCLIECQLEFKESAKCVGYSVNTDPVTKAFQSCTLLQELINSNCTKQNSTQFFKLKWSSSKHNGKFFNAPIQLPPQKGLIDAFNPKLCGKGSTVNLYDPKQQSGKILGGNDAEPGEFPYQVLIEIRMNNTNYEICGGSLIDRQWIFTAGHCIKAFLEFPGAKSINISIGRLNYWDEMGGYSLFRVADQTNLSNIFLHPKYNQARSPVYDFGLMKLPQALKGYSASVSPICLPPKAAKDITNKVVLTTGWGLSNNREHVEIAKKKQSIKDDLMMLHDAAGKPLGFPDRLQKLPRRIVPQQDCQRFMDGWGYDSKIMLCSSKSGGRDQCNGDSGGPWAIVDRPFDNDPKWILVGVTSWGTICGLTFGVGANINDEILNWIKETTKPT